MNYKIKTCHFTLLLQRRQAFECVKLLLRTSILYSLLIQTDYPIEINQWKEKLLKSNHNWCQIQLQAMQQLHHKTISTLINV